MLDASMLPERGVGVGEIVQPETAEEEKKEDPTPSLLCGWQSHVDGSGPSSVLGAVARSDVLRKNLLELAKGSARIAEEEMRLGQPESDYSHQVKALGTSLARYEGAWGDIRTYLVARQRVYGRRVTTIDAEWEERHWRRMSSKIDRWLGEEKLRDADSLRSSLRMGAC